MKPSLDIVSVGMVTAVGLDAPAACAAMRAKLDGFQETGFASPAGGWLVGAPVPLPRGWIGERRLTRLAAAAAIEALAGAVDARHDTALVLCLPEPERSGRPIRDPDLFVQRVCEIAEFKSISKAAVIAHGRPSGHVALDHAERVLAAGRARSVLIVGVDSYLTGDTIWQYLQSRRLLTEKNPNGFIPGEAAGAVLCRRSDGNGLQLFGLGLSRESARIYHPDLPFRGDGMTSAYLNALKRTGIEFNQLGYRIADLIGEQYWFKQSALASQRLLRGRHDFQDLWSPSESLGNVGAAVGPIMLGMAYKASLEGYDAGNPVLIEASNDEGACGAAILATSQAA